VLVSGTKVRCFFFFFVGKVVAGVEDCGGYAEGI
jgi:hypothetical protein